MGEATVANQTSNSITINQNSSGTTTVTGTDRLIVVTVNSNSSSVTATAVTLGSQSFTLWHTVTSGASHLEVWYLVAPTLGASLTSITVTMASSSTPVCNAFMYNHVNQTTPFGANTTT